MKKNVALFILQLLMMSSISACKIEVSTDHEQNDDLKIIAEKFVKYIDENDAKALASLLHPESFQFTQLGDKLIPFKGTDFVQLVADKKVGGVPRKITHKSADIIRGKTASVTLSAVSDQYDFMYQLSLVKMDNGWQIVNILTDILKVQ